MRISFMFLVLMGCSIFGMEKPSVQAAFQVVDSSASNQIFCAARNAASSGYFKRLESILEKHRFDEQQKSVLLHQTIGSKNLGKEYIDCFALLLLHGAKVDKPVHCGLSDCGTSDCTALQLIDENGHSNKYTQLALAFDSRIGHATLTRLAGMVRDQSLQVDALDDFYKQRVQLLREAFSSCDTLKDAVRREDISALKELLSGLKDKSVEAQDSQLWQALDTAISLEKTEMIDELVAHGAPIKTRLNYSFFNHPNVLKHCVSKKYVSSEDLDRYISCMPKKYSIGYFSITEQEFNEAKANAIQALMEAKRFVATKS